MHESMATGKPSASKTIPRTTPIEVVSVALLVACLVLAARIATTW